MLQAILLLVIVGMAYVKGFVACMFGAHENLFQSIRKKYIESGGEDIWQNDENID